MRNEDVCDAPGLQRRAGPAKTAIVIDRNCCGAFWTPSVQSVVASANIKAQVGRRWSQQFLEAS